MTRAFGETRIKQSDLLLKVVCNGKRKMNYIT